MLLNTAGPEVMVPLDPSRSVYPSALAFATAAVPIRPPAPLRFSTRTCWPRASEKAGATVRAVMSTLPLGGQGTTILTARLGKSWAPAPAAAAIARTGIHRLIIALLRPNGGRDFRIPAWICWNMRVMLLFTAGSGGRSRRSSESSNMLAAERVKVFWQPGCTSCLRTKEFLTKSGVDYESINVHGNPAGMEELRKLGARSVPVVARGGKFVFAQALGDVIEFLDLKVQAQERLSPDELVKKLELVLPAACRYIRQIPAEWLDKPFRNRNRPIRVLCHHVFRIVEGFLESMDDGRELTYERIMKEAPALRSGEDIARFGESVLARLQAWWKTCPDRSCSRVMDTYFGKHPLHVVLERTAWHPAQHTRQLMLILDTLKIEPDRRLTAQDLAGLPLPDKAWDDEKEAA